MEDKIKINKCDESVKQKVLELREKLEKIYLEDIPYEEKMKVSIELDKYIVEATKQINGIK
ncbi:MAG: hypothetical protein RR988_01455 [Clostridia bacterium]